MILFSDRMKIERLFIEWCEENGVAQMPNSLVAFMQTKGWLNEDKINDDMRGKRKWNVVKNASSFIR